LLAWSRAAYTFRRVHASKTRCPPPALRPRSLGCRRCWRPSSPGSWSRPPGRAPRSMRRKRRPPGHCRPGRARSNGPTSKHLRRSECGEAPDRRWCHSACRRSSRRPPRACTATTRCRGRSTPCWPSRFWGAPLIPATRGHRARARMALHFARACGYATERLPASSSGSRRRARPSCLRVRRVRLSGCGAAPPEDRTSVPSEHAPRNGATRSRAQSRALDSNG